MRWYRIVGSRECCCLVTEGAVSERDRWAKAQKEHSSLARVSDTLLCLQKQVGLIQLVVAGVAGDGWQKRVLLPGFWECLHVEAL